MNKEPEARALNHAYDLRSIAHIKAILQVKLSCCAVVSDLLPKFGWVW